MTEHEHEDRGRGITPAKAVAHAPLAARGLARTILGAEMVLAAALARVLLHRVPLPYLAKAAKSLGLGVMARKGGWGEHRLYGLVDRATRMTHGGHRCLPRSLLLFGALPKEQQPELVLGVRKVDGHVQAHAWVETGGAPLGMQRDPDGVVPGGEFTVLLRLR